MNVDLETRNYEFKITHVSLLLCIAPMYVKFSYEINSICFAKCLLNKPYLCKQLQLDNSLCSEKVFVFSEKLLRNIVMIWHQIKSLFDLRCIWSRKVSLLYTTASWKISYCVQSHTVLDWITIMYHFLWSPTQDDKTTYHRIKIWTILA